MLISLRHGAVGAQGEVGERPGVGQYSMLHMMMPKGARLFDSLMPGYIEGVVARGGCQVSMFKSRWVRYFAIARVLAVFFFSLFLLFSLFPFLSPHLFWGCRG